jgi:hypothetical protein
MRYSEIAPKTEQSLVCTYGWHMSNKIMVANDCPRTVIHKLLYVTDSVYVGQ